MAKVDLSDYGYVNARVRAMRSHLLTSEFFMRLVEAEDFETVHQLLEQTVYRREINEVILMHPERPDYDQALNVNLYAAFKKISDSTGGEAHQLVSLLLSDYDVYNLKTIIRGKKAGATPGEVVNLLVPAGGIRMETLEMLLKAGEIRDVVDTMGNLQIRYARPLAQALPAYFKHDQDLAFLELAIDKYHFGTAVEALDGKRYGSGANVEMVRRIITSEIDIRNISTLVRIRGIRLEDKEVITLCIPGGSLSPDQFLYLDRLGDVVQIVSEYPDPRYRKVLERALSEYQEYDVAAFDRELEHELTKLGVGMGNIDVLGIGVIIGFIFAKKNEVSNLRLIMRGKALDQTDAEIKKNLYFIERAENGS